MKLERVVICWIALAGLSACGPSTLLPADMVLPDGSEYRGAVVDGKFEGDGIQTFPDGSVYVGQFKGGRWSGEGTLTFLERWRYHGQFENGMFKGQGTFSDESSDYTGEFETNMFNGHGELHYNNGDHYVGAFHEGKFQGDGVFSYADGSVISATFERGRPVTGTLTSEHDRYEGEFAEWRYHGQGRYDDGEGGVYVGSFVEGSFTGTGSYDDDDEHYTGEFLNWYYHGKGALTRDDGSIVEATFSYGSPDGKAVLISVDEHGTQHRQQGSWLDGEFVADGEKSSRVTREQMVDQALTQNQLRLMQQINSLKGQTPGQRDVYFLAVGGDGSEGVFGRDIDVARQALAQVYDIDGRALYLLNSRDYAQFPLATPTTVATALQALDAIMDANEDLLFIHLTSHGGRRGNFSLKQPGMSLPDLMPDDFAEVLSKLSVRKKVIVVSACYSGQWLDQLKSGGLMMLMSARRDRTSFGCGDTSDMTWFTKAVYQQGGVDIEHPDAWFARIDESIRSWEIEEGFDDKRWSHPQFFAGAEMRAWLAGRRTPMDR